MPKYLIQATYTAEGIKGLQKDKATGRKTAVVNALEPLKGKLEALYFTFGQDDVACIIDLPDNIAASAFSLAVSAAGLVHARTTPLLTCEEVDQALQKTIDYRPPGR
jgi:uncharacterized protein with GYD domain